MIQPNLFLVNSTQDSRPAEEGAQLGLELLRIIIYPALFLVLFLLMVFIFRREWRYLLQRMRRFRIGPVSGEADEEFDKPDE